MCLQTKEVGKALLKDIAARRKELERDVDNEAVPMDETVGNILPNEIEDVATSMDVTNSSAKF